MTPGNDPFAGASLARARPPTAVAGPFSSANTSVGNPIGGVNPSAIKYGRDNEGSNIPVPYHRLVPPSSMNGGGLPYSPQAAASLAGGKFRSGLGAAQEKSMITETTNLRATTIAFVLGKRSAPDGRNATPFDGVDAIGIDPAYGTSFGINGILAPGVKDHNRFAKLCSMEYLERYFRCILRGVKIDVPNEIRETGDMAYLKNKDGSDLGALGGTLKTLAGSDMDGTKTGADRAKVAKRSGAAYVSATDASAALRRQGLFVADKGPFLRGKGITSGMVDRTGTKGPVQDPATGKIMVQPGTVERNLGDKFAFSWLWKQLLDKGVLDWVPDGIVQSKLLNDPSDAVSDERFDARDGELYNVVVQGPALSSSWSGPDKTHLEVLPLDKVFVAIVADVWFQAPSDLPVIADPYGSGSDSLALYTLTLTDNSFANAREKRAPSAQPALLGVALDPSVGGSVPRPPDPGLASQYDAAMDKYRAYDQRNQDRAAWDANNALYEADVAALAEIKAVRDNVGNAKQAVADRATATPDGDKLTRYMRAKEAYLSLYGLNTQKGSAAFAKNQGIHYATKDVSAGALAGDSSEARQATMINFRPVLMTSSQMVRFSAYSASSSHSRCGLALCGLFGEYVVGAWSLGNILDSAASRAALPGGSLVGIREAPNSKAHTLNVGVEWYDADRLYRSYMNVEGKHIAQRFAKRGSAADFEDAVSVPPGKKAKGGGAEAWVTA